MQLAKPYWGKLGLIMLLLIAGVVMDLLPPYLTRGFLLMMYFTFTQSNANLLIWLVLGLLGIRIGRVVVTILNNWLNH